MADIEPQPPDNAQAPESSPAPVSTSRSTPPLQGRHLPMEEAELSEISVELRRHQGPLPSPQDYREYAALIPNGAERLMRMAEKEQNHQHRRDLKQESRATLGVVCAFSSVVGAVALSGYGFYTGYAVEAAAIFGATLTAIVTVFIRGTAIRSERQEQEKDEQKDAD